MSKKIALVFGGTRGIGAATVQKLAEGGFEVAYTYVSSAPNVPAKIAGASTKGYQVDIREAAQVAQVFTDVARDFGSMPHCVVAIGPGGTLMPALATTQCGMLPKSLATSVKTWAT